jgi:isoquinoline 1-oxidoreductase beta subunit
MDTQSVSRRNFLKVSGLTGVILSLGLYLPTHAEEAEIINTAGAADLGTDLNAWIRIDALGKVTITDHRAEMGQGSYQAVPQIIAEELEVPLNEVAIVFAQGNRKYGSQITGGSSTVRGSYKNLLKLSATARQMLIQAAANQWNVPVTDCYAEAGHVIHKPSGKKANYGTLVADAAKLEPPKDVVLKNRADYKQIGKPLHRPDTPLKTNGTAGFGLDKTLPGMLYAAVERNPRLRGKVKSVDDTAARKVPGVKQILKVTMLVHSTQREGVAVIAESTWAALQGKKALKVTWDDSGFEHLSSEQIYKRQHEALQTNEGLSLKQQGDVADALAKGSKKLDVVYQTPYQSHSCMEPLNCTAYYQADKVEIWGPIQAPDMVQDFISREMKLPREKIIVNMTFLGGGFGRKAFTDYPYEAAVISKAVGAPIQVVWTREDDSTQGPFRPGISYRCEGAVADGKISAFKLRMAGQNLGHWMGAPKDKPNNSTNEGFLKPYTESIKNLSIADVPFETPIPVLWWRSVYASTNGFAYESFIDELAHEARKDPMTFRREHLPDERVQKQLDKLAEVSGWNSRKPGEGYGMAITECFSSTVGQVVKVSKNPNGGVKIDHVWAVMDCGWYVNPDTVKAQVEGSIVMALGAATQHEVTFKDGMAVDKNFYSYQMPRITDIPPIDVFIMDNDADAGGVGEPGLPTFSPALTNAIFDLTGKRIRKLPFSLATV